MPINTKVNEWDSTFIFSINLKQIEMKKRRRKLDEDDIIFIMMTLFLLMMGLPNLRFLFEESEEDRKERKLKEAIEYVVNTDWSSFEEPVDDDMFEEKSSKEVKQLSALQKKAEKKKKDKKAENKKSGNKMAVNHHRRVTVTQYHPVTKQCDGDPLITADNSKINLSHLKKGRIRWVAVSRDLLKVYKYGDTVELTVESGNRKINGRYVIHDTMNPRWTNRVDILTPIGEPVSKWTNVHIKKIKGEGA